MKRGISVKILSQELKELQNVPQWVAFELRPKQDRSGEFSKIPINPKTGRGAMANNPATWGTFEEAKSYAECNGLFQTDGNGRQCGGVGFELGNGYAGIDLDHVILPDGSLKSFARKIVGIMDSYTEFSPSGTGLHILFTVDGSPEQWREFLGGKLGTKVGDIEFYTGLHYLTVTGKPYGKIRSLEKRTKQAQEVYRRYLIKSEPKNSNLAPLRTSNANFQFQSELTDNELLEKIFNSRNGLEVKALFSGDLSRHGGDESAADLALCNHLAFWTNGDAVRMDSLFRQSGLMREKWNRPTAGSTYGAITINKAIQSMRNSYTVRKNTQNFNYTSSEYSQRKAAEIEAFKQEFSEQDRKRFESEGGTDILNEFNEFVLKNQSDGGISTGFENLDGLLDGGFYPGLYVVGAVSSLGKTTFVLQVADNMAKAGHGVLIFSLEMSKFELIAKTLSRMSFIKSLEEYQSSVYAKTTRSVLLGRYRNEFDSKIMAEAMQDYSEWGSNIHITQGIGNIGVAEIKEKIEEFKKFRNKPPVVVIDYLQILAPYEKGLTDKQNTDKNITELKRLSRDFDIPILGISSFNRENYSAPVSMASFKESGAIEYSSDVLIGLQYDGWDYDEGEGEAVRLKRLRRLKKDLRQKAQNFGSQDIQLKILKNRNGIKGDLLFEFFPAFNCFRPQVQSNA